MPMACAGAYLRVNPVRLSRTGFTLLEVVVALALIGLVASLVVVNFDSAFKNMGVRPPEDVFRIAVRQARYEAAYRMQKTYLAFDPEKNEFTVVDANGEICGTFPLNRDPTKGRFEVTFTGFLPEDNIGAKDKNELSDYTMERLVFDPSGCGVPAKVTIKGPDESAELTLDPFSWGEPPERPEMQLENILPK